MNHDSLIQLLPQLLNKRTGKSTTAEAEAVCQSSDWYEEEACSDQTSTPTQSDSEESPEANSDQDDGTGGDNQDAGSRSPKPVNLDDIEKFLDGITKPNTPRPAPRQPRDMANILREVDELGRRTLSSSSLLAGGGRPPPSPRPPSGAHSPVPPPATGAASESALLPGADAGRQSRFSQAQQTNGRDKLALLPPRSVSKLSLSEPALGYTLQSLMSEEKKKYLNLTADMILLKQSSLENEIQMKSQWDEHLRDLMTENSSLKLEIEMLHTRPPPSVQGNAGERTRLKNLEHRVEEQNRLLDGFNAENARLYRELKQLKTERAGLETVVDDLQCEQRLLNARLQAAQRPSIPSVKDRQQDRERQLRRRELELEQRWQEVKTAGNEVERLHDMVTQRQTSACARCQGQDSDGVSNRGQLERNSRPRTVSVSCQTVASSSPPRSPTRSPAHSPSRSLARSPEHVAAAATAEVHSLRAALAHSKQRLEQELQAATIRETDLRRACDAKVRAAEGRLRRLQSSPTRPDPELMAALRRLKAQLADKERALTQSRRQLEKSQRTVTGLQRERERLLVTIAARSPGGRSEEAQSRRGSPNRSQQVSPGRSQRASPVRRASVASMAAVEGRCVDETLLSELQTAIAAVEEENVLLKSQLSQMKINKDEEVNRRDSQITALRNENTEIRAKLAAVPSPPPSVRASERDETVLSARKDSLMLEMGSHMEAQEHVIVHLRETIRRFRQQTRLIAGLEEENRTLRDTIETLHWQSGVGRQRPSSSVQESNQS